MKWNRKTEIRLDTFVILMRRIHIYSSTAMFLLQLLSPVFNFLYDSFLGFWLIEDCAASYHTVIAHYILGSWAYRDWNFYDSGNDHMRWPPMHLQTFYIDDKFLASILLYSYIISKPGQEQQILFQITFTLKLTTALKAGNIFHL